MSPSENSNQSEFVLQAGEFSTRDLLVARLDGEEAISSLFHYRLMLVSANNDIDPEMLLGKAALVTIMANPNQREGGRPEAPEIARFVNGIASRFEHLFDGQRNSYYAMEIVPVFWQLELRSHCRIFQKMSSDEIVKKIIDEAGIPAQMYKFSLSNQYSKREYCVQYRETDWQFIQRLLEEDGIFYFFEHDEKNHVLVMGDTNQVPPPIVGLPEIPFRGPAEMTVTEHVMDFRAGSRLRTGKVILRDFEYTKPVPAVEAMADAGLESELEVYDYPGQYVSEDSKKEAVTKRLSKTRLEEMRATRTFGRGKALCRRLICGTRFFLVEHSRATANQEYLLTKLRIKGFQAQVGEEEFLPPAVATGPNYLVKFACIPQKVPFRPRRSTPKPVVKGSQTAIVVGPSGEEIHTDEHGRVKVHFHWDREGEFKENDSCWIRVNQSWAGGQYGSIHIPRIGQEVIVDFLEGDPDLPIITGRVYNGDQKPPYDLPDNKTRSTLRTNSSLDGGGANELRFEDMKGKEQIFLHAEKDLHIRAKNDRVVNIMNDAHETIDRDCNQYIKSNNSRTVDSMESISVGGKRSLTVKGDLHEDLKVNHYAEVGMNFSQKAGMNTVIETGLNLTLKGAGGFISITPAGIFISGTMVMINSGGAPTPATPPQVVAPTAPIDADTEEPGHDVSYTGETKTVPPLKLTTLKEKSWVKLKLHDDLGNPVPGEPYEVITADGKKITGALDARGEAKIAGIEPGTCQISFPERHPKEWKRG